MTFRSDETIQCAQCGRPFTWSFSEQRIFRERGLAQPQYCDVCREIRKGERRSGQFDHPSPSLAPFPVSLSPSTQSTAGYEVKPSEPPADIPGTEVPALRPAIRPSWWSNPINRYNVALVVLTILVIVTLGFLVQMIFDLKIV